MKRTLVTFLAIILLILTISTSILHEAYGEAPYTWGLDQYKIAKSSIPYSTIDTAVIVGDTNEYKVLVGELRSRGIEVVQANTMKDAIDIIGGRSPILVVVSSKENIEPSTLASLLKQGNPILIYSKLYTVLIDLVGSSARPMLPGQGFYAMVKPVLDGYHIFLAQSLAGTMTVSSLVDAVLREDYLVKDSCHQLISIVSASAEWQPYGALQVDNYLYYYSCESMQDRDPYYVKAVSEIIPGKYLGWSDGWREWWSDRLYTRYDLSQDPGIDLHDFDPRGIIGDPASYTVTLQIPFSIAVSWELTDDDPVQTTTSLGSSYTNIAEWVHELGSGFWSIFPSGTDLPMGVAPGFSFTAAEGSHTVQYWEVTGEWSRPGYRGIPVDSFQGTLVIELHLVS